MDLNSLPEDVLLHIFSYLNIKEKIELKCVCQLWQKLLFRDVKHIRFVSSKRKKRISLTEPNIIKTERFDDVCKALTENNFCNLRSIDIIGLTKDCHGCTNLMHVTESLKNIVSLRFYSNMWFTQYRIETLMSCMSNLEKISWYARAVIQQKELAKIIIKSNPNVNYLNIPFLDYKDVYTMIDAMSQRWKGLRMTVSCFCKEERSLATFDSLEKLSLDACPTMIESGSLRNFLCSQKLKQLQLKIHHHCCERDARNLKLPQLHSESLEVLHVQTKPPYIINNASHIMQCVPNLKVLDIRTKRFTDGCVELLTINCRRLQYLRIDDGEITDNSLISLLNLHRLEVLLLLGKNAITVKAMNDFIEKAPSLRVLSCNLQVLEAFISRANRVHNCLHFAFIPVTKMPQVIPANLYVTRRYLKAYGMPVGDVIWYYLFDFRKKLNIDNDYFDWKRVRMSELRGFIAKNIAKDNTKHDWITDSESDSMSDMDFQITSYTDSETIDTDSDTSDTDSERASDIDSESTD